MIKTDGYFLLHRSIFENPTVTKDADYFITWIYILSQAEWKSGKKVEFGGKTIELQAGQFTTGVSGQMLGDIKKVNKGLNVSKLNRVLKKLKSEKQIEQRTDHQCSLITVLNWEKYQLSEQRNEKQVNNDRITSEQRVNTNELKEENKERNKRNKNKPPISPFDELEKIDLSENMKTSLREWFEYKKQRKEKSYQTEMGFKKFITQVRQAIEKCGEEKVIEQFDYAMSRGWSGAYLEKIEPEKNTQFTFDDIMQELNEDGD